MLDDLVLVLLVAAAVPLSLAVVPRWTVPAAVVEITAGIVLGPDVLGLVEADQAVRTVATIGVAFLLFLAGLEIDLRELRGRLAGRALRGLGLSLLAAAVVGAGLQAGGLVQDGRLVGVLLLATSLGLVVPLLRDAGLSGRPTGRLVVAGASLGELSALVLLGLTATERSGGMLPVLLLLAVLGGLAALVLVGSARAAMSSGVQRVVGGLADTSAQIRVRLAVLLVVGLAALSERLGFELVLGAFLAGLVLGRLDPDGAVTHPHFRLKLDGIGFGFVVPVFFVTSGLMFDVDALREDPGELAKVPLFLLALLVVRALPAVVYRSDLAWRDVAAAGLFQATSLPVLVVGAAIGRETGALQPGSAAALVGAGLLSVLLLPVVALRLASAAVAQPAAPREQV